MAEFNMDMIKQVDIAFEKVRLMEEEFHKETVRRLHDHEYTSIIKIEQEILWEEKISRQASNTPRPKYVDEEIIVVNLDPKLSHLLDKKLFKPRVRGYHCYVCDCTVDYDIPFVEHRKDSLHQEQLQIPTKMREALAKKNAERAAAKKRQIENGAKSTGNDGEENKENMDTSTEEESRGKKRPLEFTFNEELAKENAEELEWIRKCLERGCKRPA